MMKPIFKNTGCNLFSLADVDQALAAEPGFHRDPPSGRRTGEMSTRLCSDHHSEQLEPQTKNGSPCRLEYSVAKGNLTRLQALDGS